MRWPQISLPRSLARPLESQRASRPDVDDEIATILCGVDAADPHAGTSEINTLVAARATDVNAASAQRET